MKGDREPQTEVQIRQTLLRNKEDNYSDYDKEYFKECLSAAFNVVRHEKLDSGRRILYYAKSKQPAM